MRVVSYNILQGGQPDDGVPARLDALIDVLERARPDLLWLCECNGFERNPPPTLQRLEQRLGMRGVLGRADSGFHVALLARDAVWGRVRVLNEGLAHAAICADLQLAGGEVRVLGAHLDPYAGSTRLAEVQRLTALLPGDGPAIVLGDLNAISPHDVSTLEPAGWPERYRDRHMDDAGHLDTRAIAALHTAGLLDLLHEAGARGPTRPTELYRHRDVPAQRLDYIFASRALAERMQSARVLDEHATQHASDHLPVLVDFD